MRQLDTASVHKSKRALMSDFVSSFLFESTMGPDSRHESQDTEED